MAGQEEQKASMGVANWMLTPCTAAKSEKDAVAGDEGPAVQGSTKREAVAGSSYKEGDRPPEGWIDVYALAEPASFDPFGAQSRAAAIDKMLQDAKLPAAPVAVKQAPAAAAAAGGATAGGGSKTKRRLTKCEIKSIIALKPEPFPSADYLDELAQFEPPETIAEKRRQHEADVAYFGDRNEKYEAFRQKVIKGLKEDGYYEVDLDYVAARDKANQRAIRAPRKPFSWMKDPSDLKGHIATPEDHQRRLREGCYRRYVPDAEDARLISYGEEDDDDSMSEEGDDSASDDEDEDAEEAKGHRGAPLVEAN